MTPDASSITAENDELRWRLRLFFSVDLVGSTEYKSRAYSAGANWIQPFEYFYENFPTILDTEISKSFRAHDLGEPDESLNPVVWKFLGDEILLHVELVDSSHVLHYLNAFRNSLNRFSSDKVIADARLGCKGAVWSAGFPVTNKQVNPPEKKTKPKEQKESKKSPEHDLEDKEQKTIKDPKGPIDFIGPSVDCGFRLCKYASGRKMPVSLDVVWMAVHHLMEDRLNARQWNDEFIFHFEGMEYLKGILGNRPYPVFWLDLISKATRKNSYPETILREEECFAEQDQFGRILDFCHQFSMSNCEYLFRPFIENDRSGAFTGPPLKLQKDREKLIETRKNPPNPDPAPKDEAPVMGNTDVKKAIIAMMANYEKTLAPYSKSLESFYEKTLIPYSKSLESLRHNIIHGSMPKSIKEQLEKGIAKEPDKK